MTDMLSTKSLDLDLLLKSLEDHTFCKVYREFSTNNVACTGEERALEFCQGQDKSATICTGMEAAGVVCNSTDKKSMHHRTRRADPVSKSIIFVSANIIPFLYLALSTALLNAIDLGGCNKDDSESKEPKPDEEKGDRDMHYC